MNEVDAKEAAKLLPDISLFAHGIGPRESLIFDADFFSLAKKLNLKVHPWTMMDDRLQHTGDPISENLLYM
jgi:glycerophosphoryl diester phosphodiesterase